MRLALTIAVLVVAAYAEFTPDFAKWLDDYYGPEVRMQMERRDLGGKGSFGGKVNRNDKLKRQPVVFVHGVSDTAGEKMRHASNHFKKFGYVDNELYGTTYFNGAQGNPLKWTEYSMKCEYVKQVRALIVAVRLYTGRSVDVIGFSLGVPVSRKAILGGVCVDTGEDLGGPLTRFIDTYVGVAGPNHGINLQLGGVSLPGCALGLMPICNQNNGLYSGMCPAESQYLQDINRMAHYEGQHVYSVYSRQDQIVGHMVCGKITSQIPGQDGEKAYDGLNHDQAFELTHEVQVRMLSEHRVI